MWSILGILFVFYVFWRFVNALGKSLPVLELMMLIAGLQWVVGPYISYRQETSHYKYYMYVNEDTYMGYVVPALLCFSIPLFFILKRKITWEAINFVKFVPYSKGLLVIGVGSDILSSVSPSSLLFFFFLISQFKFIGAIILFFSRKKSDQYFFYGAIIYLLANALARAMFHDLLLWSVFMFMYWCLKKNPTFKTKLLLIFTGVLFAISIQVVKSNFRANVWGGYSGNKLDLFVDTLNEKVSTGYFDDDENTSELNVRLNQGWIISAIMYYTPSYQPFGEGETILDAIYSSFLPRFLIPNKKMAGGQENFEKFTGFILAGGTSMGMSIIGESYANFGITNGIVFMLIWGCFLAWYWKWILKLINKYPLILMFLPVLFLQVIKAETELVVVLNHLIKASIVVALFFWFAQKYLNWHLKERI